MTPLEIKAKILAEIYGYDSEEYRREIAESADKYGVSYTEFTGTDVNKDNFGMASTSKESSRTKWIVAIIILVVVAGGGGFFAYKKGYLDKWIKK